MTEEKPLLYFKTQDDWYTWLEDNHQNHSGVYLILYKLETNIPTLRWEEAVKVALCFGWIDSTVKRLDHQKRRQYFCPRNPKSAWSTLNKSYIDELEKDGLIHQSGSNLIEEAKLNGSWDALNDVENLVIPPELKVAFSKHPKAFLNYSNFPPSSQKSYLYWLFMAKRETTRQKRISSIIEYCLKNLKTRP